MANSRSSGKPYLKLTVEPENKFRFRYLSESEKSSHGGILGKGPETRTKKSPKIYPSVQLINYHEKRHVSISVTLYTKSRSEKHVLELKGNNDGLFLQDLDSNDTAVFKNLAIINKKQDEVLSILLERKLKKLANCGSAARKKLQAQSKDEFKRWMADNLDSVVLCFEAVYTDQPDMAVKGCQRIFSDTIKNQKSSLRITRISHCSGSCSGGQEIILLCDKVKKDEIKIIFSDGKEDDPDTWKEEGRFDRKVDVHHQVAIAFRVPPYKEDVEKTVNMYLEQDNERSESIEFNYIPSDSSPKKRKRIEGDAQVPSHQLQSMNIVSPSCSNSDTSSESCLYQIIPEPTDHDVTDSGLSYTNLKNIWQQLSGGVAENLYCDLQEENLAETLNLDDNEFFLPPGNSVQGDLFASEELFEDLGGGIADLNSYDIDGCVSSLPSADVTDSSVRERGSKIGMPQHREDLLKDPHNLSTSSSSSSKSKDSVDNRPFQKHLKPIRTPDEVKLSAPSEELHSLLDKKNRKNANANSDEQILQVNYFPAAFTTVKDTPKKGINEIELQSPNFEDKEKFLHLLSKKDNYGNTFLHLVALNCKKLNPVLNKIIKLLLSSSSDIVNVQNYRKQTPIRLATEKNNYHLVKFLLVTGANPNIKDLEGNNCYHVASQNNFTLCLRELFHYPDISGVDAFNYEGLTPLHIAVMKKSKECFHLLLKKAKINSSDKKGGRTPLHHAVESSSFVTDLLQQPDVDVNFQDFAGNSPLHIASSLGHLVTVEQLLDAGADASLKNFKQSLEITEESPQSEVFDGQTPLDIAANEQVIQLLKEYIQNDNAEFSDVDNSDCYGDTPEFALLEEELCSILDCKLKKDDWKKLQICVGMDESNLDTIFKCGFSPTKAVLSSLKKVYEDEYIKVFYAALETAGYDDIVKEIKQL